jgi:hypothetical protein
MADVSYRGSPGDEERRKFSPTFHAVTVLDSVDRAADDGFVYHASGKVTGMIDANVDDFLLVTPAAPEVHLFRASLSLGRGDIDILVYEGTATSADGAALTELNINRTSSNTPGAVLTFGPTVTGVGTLIHTDWVPPTAAGIGATAAGVVDSGTGEEWMLLPSTKYLIRITNNSGATIDYRWEFAWMEPDYPAGET